MNERIFLENSTDKLVFIQTEASFLQLNVEKTQETHSSVHKIKIKTLAAYR